MTLIQDEKDAASFAEQRITYENYYGLDPSDEVPRADESAMNIGAERTNKVPYEDYVQQRASKYIFENDLLEKEYKFWETNFEKEERLKKLWIQVRRD